MKIDVPPEVLGELLELVENRLAEFRLLNESVGKWGYIQVPFKKLLAWESKTTTARTNIIARWEVIKEGLTQQLERLSKPDEEPPTPVGPEETEQRPDSSIGVMPDDEAKKDWT